MAVRFVGEAPLPRIVMGPVSKQHYLINPGRETIQVDERDGNLFLAYTGEIRFQRG